MQTEYHHRSDILWQGAQATLKEEDVYEPRRNRGGPAWNRTMDPSVMSRLLCR